MLKLSAADSKNQDKLNKEIERFERFFLKLESEFAGERSNAATMMIESLRKINELQGATAGRSGFFGLRQILEGADHNGPAQELKRAKELIQEFEVNNQNLAAAEALLRHEVERLQADVQRLKSETINLRFSLAAKGAGPGKAPPSLPQGKPIKDFLVGALGVSVGVTIIVSWVFDLYPWVNVLLLSAFGIAILPFALQFFGTFALSVGDEVQYRIAVSAEGIIRGLKAISFSFVLLFVAGLVGKAAGAGTFLGVSFPAPFSGSGLMVWMISVAASGFGVVFLVSGVGLFFLFRGLMQKRSLPEPLQWLFS